MLTFDRLCATIYVTFFIRKQISTALYCGQKGRYTMELLNQIENMRQHFDTEEMECVEDMILKAARYVREVVAMETTARNLIGRNGEELREAVSSADSTRRVAHNSLIAATDIVNRLCTNHGLPLIYTGDSLRRHYGDFAIALVTGIFNKRG